MQIGMIGLGKMGGNMAERLRRAGHDVVGYDHHPETQGRRNPGRAEGPVVRAACGVGHGPRGRPHPADDR